ncbi:MAG: hypothetical protein JNL17_06715 [Cyclobacteriaceae bacterium]|nr:hypothetical protein [Cyclobacteriaceae bacterium]
MDEKHTLFLKVSGEISPGKHREFEQTIRFIFNNLPSACIRRNLALDVYQKNLYHMFSMWGSEEGLRAFTASHEFHLLKGAFMALGEYREAATGKLVDARLFDMSDPGT